MNQEAAQDLWVELLKLRQAHEHLATQSIYIGNCILIGFVLAAAIIGFAMFVTFHKPSQGVRRHGLPAQGQEADGQEQEAWAGSSSGRASPGSASATAGAASSRGGR